MGWPNLTERGFTLLEVMIALVIVGMVLTGLIGLAQRQVQSSETIQRTTQATLLAQGVLSRLEVGLPPQDDATETQGVFPEPQDIYRWRVERKPSPLDGVEEVTVTVAWGEEARREAVSIISFLR